MSSLFTKFCFFPFENLEANIPSTNFVVFSRSLKLMRQWILLYKWNNCKIKADATLAAFKISLTVLSLIPFLNALGNYYNSNRVDVLGRKYVFGPSQHSFFKMSLSRAKNIFTPANINSIVIFTWLPKGWRVKAIPLILTLFSPSFQETVLHLTSGFLINEKIMIKLDKWFTHNN